MTRHKHTITQIDDDTHDYRQTHRHAQTQRHSHYAHGQTYPQTHSHRHGCPCTETHSCSSLESALPPDRQARGTKAPSDGGLSSLLTHCNDGVTSVPAGLGVPVMEQRSRPEHAGSIGDRVRAMPYICQTLWALSFAVCSLKVLRDMEADLIP